MKILIKKTHDTFTESAQKEKRCASQQSINNMYVVIGETSGFLFAHLSFVHT